MYEIPKLEVPIVLHLTNREAIEGKIFVTYDLVSPAGNPKIDEFLNEGPDFFSFESNAGAYRLVNKSQVVFVETEQTDQEVREQTPMDPRSVELHFIKDITVYGLLFPTMAEESRVSDILNQEDDFIAIYRQGMKVIINRNQVVYANPN